MHYVEYTLNVQRGARVLIGRRPRDNFGLRRAKPLRNTRTSIRHPNGIVIVTEAMAVVRLIVLNCDDVIVIVY